MTDISDIKATARDLILPESTDDDLIAEMQKRGYVAHKPEPAKKPVKFDLSRLSGSRIRLGVISDTHFGSKFQQPTYLREHLAYMKKQRVDAICFAGDVTDGGTKMHPGFEYETFSHGADAQEEEAADILIPEAERLRVPWYVIGGNHDNSHYKQGGIDIVERLCRRSDWFNYLSPGLGNARNSVGFIRIGRLLVEICHPHMGSAYAWSYRGQKWIEALSPENKPHLVLMGNFHKPLQMDYRNIHYLMLPAYQSQSSWMASKSLVSTVGSAILEVGTEPMGLSPSIKLEWLIERVPREKDWG